MKMKTLSKETSYLIMKDGLYIDNYKVMGNDKEGILRVFKTRWDVELD